MDIFSEIRATPKIHPKWSNRSSLKSGDDVGVQWGGDDEIKMMMMLVIMVKTYMSWCTVGRGGGVGVSLGEQSKPISRF